MGSVDKKYPQIVNSAENRELLYKDKCDKYDYLTAAGCGTIGGLVDIFLVGSPGETVIGQWTDAQVDNVVMGFARKMGWKPEQGNEKNIQSAIGFFERNFKVNYDQSTSVQVGNLFEMGTKNHHMKSLAHSPDIIGLFFSVLNQFTSTSTFISNGQVITIVTDTYELQGGNFIAKIFCGIANWFGHLLSDIAGSTGSRGNGGRGTGIVMPFYELFGICSFGKFNVGQDKQDLATIATRAFQEGYDFRFGLAQALPVIITDLTIRLIWSLRRYFQYQRPLKECMPTQRHADLRVMLLVGNGTLCIMDGVDAGLRSGGNVLTFFMSLNLIAWFRLVALVLKEVCIRVGITENIKAVQRINEDLLQYLSGLEKIDKELFEKETEAYNREVRALEKITSSEELNRYLLETFERLKIKKPWEGDFSEHMANKNGTLIFE